MRCCLAILALFVPLTGCIRPPAPPATTPMRQVRSGATEAGAERARCLFVFFPGYGAEPEAVVEHGFIDQLDANVDADWTVPNAHIGYYVEQTVLHRVEQDVINPAKAAGYERVWLVAISMGALGAIGYAATHAEQVEGVVLLAPWMGLGFGFGLSPLEREIRENGGLVAWRDGLEDQSSLDGGTPLSDLSEEEDFFHLLWAWSARAMRPDGSRVPIYVGYGRQDRYVRSQDLLADAYPERQRLVTGGVHHWDVFYDIWRGFLWQGFLQRSCGRAEPSSAVVTASSLPNDRLH